MTATNEHLATLPAQRPLRSFLVQPSRNLHHPGSPRWDLPITLWKFFRQRLTAVFVLVIDDRKCLTGNDYYQSLGPKFAIEGFGIT